MDKKSLAFGVLATVAASTASATVPTDVDLTKEKQAQMEVITQLIGSVEAVMFMPECTVNEA
ncbi:MAG TPA: hypothetical protein VHD33_00940 [Legionellaceae bacterium]|nr:hypothetical protein [Legionellaceae bacterium]